MYKNLKVCFNYRYVENDKAVICFATPRMEDPSTKKYFELYRTIFGTKPKNILPYEFKGIARYKDGDTYNVNTAKAIAKAKAVRSAFRAFEALNWEIYERFDREMLDLCDFCMSIHKRIDDTDKEIVLLTKE